MLSSAFVTLSGKYITEKKMEAITNNLANVSTAGYKVSRPAFKVATDETGAENSAQGSTVSIDELNSHIYFSEGPMLETGNVLDLAIQGNGFFAISTSNGTLYTRNGQFTLDQNKRLVTMDGNPVLGRNGEIVLDGKVIGVQDDGSIYVDKQLAATLKIVDFNDTTALKNYGRSSFINTNPGNVETTLENATVKSGFYEASNVNVIGEMVDLMASVRAYESYTKMDQALDEINSKLVDITK